MLVKLKQPANAPSPMLVTLSGMVILVKLVQFKNELPGIFVPPLITTVVSDSEKILIMEAKVRLLTAGNVILVKPLQ